jgi:hypothetical protein
MDQISTNDLKTLFAERDGHHASLYMPTEIKGQETQQNPIRFKNLMDQLEVQLAERGVGKSEARILLEPLYQLQDDFDFWQHQSGGLAVFLAGDEVYAYRLPDEFKEMATINSRFIVRPLLPLLTRNGAFYILAISQNAVRLLEADRFHARQVNLADVPTSKREALWFLTQEESIRTHTGTSMPGVARTRNRDGGGVIFSGQGEGSETQEKVRIAEFFNIVDQGVRQLIDRTTQTPLVIAGVEFLHPIYREQSEYDRLITGKILGNHDDTSDEELHRLGWEVVAPMFQQDYETARDAYLMHSGRGDGLSTNRIEEIVPAAYYQRIERLLFASDASCWGTFNPDTGEAVVHNTLQPDDEDLVDLAAYYTLLNGGEVYALGQDEVPDRGPAAATLRF